MNVIWTPTAIETVKELLEYRRTFYGLMHIKKTKSLIASAGRYLSDNPYLGQREPLLEHLEGDYRRFMMKIQKHFGTTNRTRLLLTHNYN